MLAVVGEVQISGRELPAALLARIRGDVATRPDLSRTQVARYICEALDWRGPDGELKVTSCRIALNRLSQRGVLELPSAKGHFAPAARVVASPVPSPPALSCSLKELGELSAVVVTGAHPDLNEQWKALMSHHYLGPGPLAGRQLRYLFRSERGWVGAAAFSACAWAVAARDAAIGWSARARVANLQHVVMNSRFFIPRWVEVSNLASKLLALCTRQLPDDWQRHYGYAPALVETYVEHERFTGASYRAANWQHVGQTAGRGRQDRTGKGCLPRKDIYLFPLDHDWRSTLCKEPGPKPPRLRNPTDWAEEEFGGAALGDARRSARLIELARTFYAHPTLSIPQACNGDTAQMQAAYRFLANDNVNIKDILEPHYEATSRRIREHDVVLAVQDTAFLNYTTHPALEGAGPIGASRKNSATGLVMHETMAFTEKGIPLGLLDVQLWARDPIEAGKKHKRHDLPIEQKESAKWLRSYEAAAAVQQQCPKTKVVSVGDREADVYELFALARSRDDHPELLIRAEHNRRVNEEQPYLWEHLEQQSLADELVLLVGRTKTRKERQATLEVRYAPVELRPSTGKRLKNVQLWAVLAKEVDTDEGVEPLEWMLLTTMEVATIEQALRMLEWYSKRWGIETFHKVLKSGCRIEERRLATVARIENCLALDLVVAWRVQYLTMLGREAPELPCTVFFEDHEWKALYAFIARSPKAVPPEPPSLRDAMRTAAKLGGFLGRKNDGEPGVKALWIGLQRLDDISMAWLAFVEQREPHEAPLSDAQRLIYGSPPDELAAEGGDS